MTLIPDPNRIIRTIAKLGTKKATKYAFIGAGYTLLVGGPIYYVLTSVKSHAKTKEQNNASANKLRENEGASECKIRELPEILIHQ